MPGRVFVEYLDKGKNRKRFNDLYATALYSDDHGLTWSSSEPFPLGGTGESGLAELTDGSHRRQRGPTSWRNRDSASLQFTEFRVVLLNQQRTVFVIAVQPLSRRRLHRLIQSEDV